MYDTLISNPNKIKCETVEGGKQQNMYILGLN
jgi:hypothetical protein